MAWWFDAKMTNFRNLVRFTKPKLAVQALEIRILVTIGAVNTSDKTAQRRHTTIGAWVFKLAQRRVGGHMGKYPRVRSKNNPFLPKLEAK